MSTFYVIWNELAFRCCYEGPKIFLPDDDENESSIRRACSLSDLSMGKGKVLSANYFLIAVNVQISFSLFIWPCAWFQLTLMFLHLHHASFAVFINFFMFLPKDSPKVHPLAQSHPRNATQLEIFQSAAPHRLVNHQRLAWECEVFQWACWIKL